MRIGLIAPPWVPVPPPAYGGTENVLDVLARGCRDAGHDVLLWTTGDSTCPVERAWTLPAAVGTAAAMPSIEINHALRGHSAVAEWGADIVHDHTLAGPLIAARRGVPAVTTNHGPFDGDLGELYRAVADDVGVIAISHAQAATSTATRIEAVIHHGLDIDRIPAGRGDGGYAVFVGRMCADKGVDRAARIARDAGIPLKIAAKVAEPPEAEYFATAVQPLLGSDVEFVGEVGGAAKWELLGGATCLLNPLRWAEPFGVVMVEALACGTPVVAPPLGAVPEIVDDGVTGFLRADDAELAWAVMASSRLDRDECRRTAVERFDRHRMTDEHLRVYRAVVGERSRLHVA